MTNKPIRAKVLDSSDQVTSSTKGGNNRDLERQRDSLQKRGSSPKRGSFQKQSEQYDDTEYNLIETTITCISIIICVITFPLSLIWMLVVVPQFERVIVLRHGKVYDDKTVGPGLICHVPCIDSLGYYDLRVNCVVIDPQEALTKDSLTVTVDAVVYSRHNDEVFAVMNVADYIHSTELLAASTIRSCIGARTLREFLVDRSAIGKQVLKEMRRLTDNWGITVLGVYIKDIRLPYQLQKAMATEAESSRLANAKILVAKAEVEATKSLQKASMILSENPMCMQLRYLQSLHTISGDHAKTIVFPYSTDTLRKIFKS